MIVVAPARYMLIDAAAAALGSTPKAIRMKMERGVWVENKQYRRAPDGRIWIDMQGVEKWVEAGPG
jgi:hypothetical protein